MAICPTELTLINFVLQFLVVPDDLEFPWRYLPRRYEPERSDKKESPEDLFSLRNPGLQRSDLLLELAFLVTTFDLILMALEISSTCFDGSSPNKYFVSGKEEEQVLPRQVNANTPIKASNLLEFFFFTAHLDHLNRLN